MPANRNLNLAVNLTGSELVSRQLKTIQGEGEKTVSVMKRLDAQGRTLGGTLKYIDGQGRQVTETFKRMRVSWADIGQLGRTMTLGLTVPIVATGAAVLKLGIDAVETRNLVKVSFGNMTDDVKRWSKTTTASLIQAELTTQRNAALFFLLAKNMGLAEDKSLKLAKNLTNLAADISSFYNISTEDAFIKLRAGLVGEYEPLRNQTGIALNEAMVKQEAYASGIARVGAELTIVDKLMARFNLIMKATEAAQGDVNRTQNEGANLIKKLSKAYTEAAQDLGTALIPALTKLLQDHLIPGAKVLGEWAKRFEELSKYEQGIAINITIGIAAAGPVLEALAQLAIIAKFAPGMLAGGGYLALGAGAVATGTGLGNIQEGAAMEHMRATDPTQGGRYPGARSVNEPFDSGGTALSIPRGSGVPLSAFNGNFIPDFPERAAQHNTLDDIRALASGNATSYSGSLFGGDGVEPVAGWNLRVMAESAVRQMRLGGRSMRIGRPFRSIDLNMSDTAVASAAMLNQLSRLDDGGYWGSISGAAKSMFVNPTIATEALSAGVTANGMRPRSESGEHYRDLFARRREIRDRAHDAARGFMAGPKTLRQRQFDAYRKTNIGQINAAFNADALLGIATSGDPFSSALGVAGGALGGPLGSILGSGLGRTLKGIGKSLFGGGRKNLEQGLTPSNPIFVRDDQLNERITQFLNVALPLISPGVAGRVNAGTGALRAQQLRAGTFRTAT